MEQTLHDYSAGYESPPPNPLLRVLRTRQEAMTMSFLGEGKRRYKGRILVSALLRTATRAADRTRADTGIRPY